MEIINVKMESDVKKICQRVFTVILGLAAFNIILLLAGIWQQVFISDTVLKAAPAEAIAAVGFVKHTYIALAFLLTACLGIFGLSLFAKGKLFHLFSCAVMLGTMFFLCLFSWISYGYLTDKVDVVAEAISVINAYQITLLQALACILVLAGYAAFRLVGLLRKPKKSDSAAAEEVE